MSDVPLPSPQPNVLLRLAAEGVVPVLGGCAGALAGGPEGGIAGVAVGHVVEKAVNLFGRGIVEQWAAWFRSQPLAEAAAAVSELVTLHPADVRSQARSFILEMAPDADAADVELAVEYLTALPRSMDRALIPDPKGGGRTIPPTVSLADPRALLQLLPEDVPPYPSGCELPSTPYRLVELVGSGGFGAVYRAFSPTLQHLPLAIKFCLDRTLLPALNQERSNLERLMRAGGAGANHVVKLYGYDLDHRTPFLVYEYVPGGDLTRHLAARRAALGGPPPANEVLGWIVQVVEGLGFAHRAKVVHRDLKPANVLVDGGNLKLADFGIGGVVAIRSVAKSRIGASTLDYLSLADQASLFRGAGTPLYMSPEQRRGADPDPRHDLYALGVMWFQLLVGDVSRELPHGWAKELKTRFNVPDRHIELIERCVGWFDDRPKDANELLPLVREAVDDTPIMPVVAMPAEVGDSPKVETVTNAGAVTPTTPQLSPSSVGLRRTLLETTLRKLDAVYSELDRMRGWSPLKSMLWGLLLALPIGWLFGEFVHTFYDRGWYSGLFPAVFRAPFHPASTFAGVLMGLIALGLYVYIIRAGMIAATDSRRKRVTELIAELATDFPNEVERWGGRAVLKSHSAVRQILDEFAPPKPIAPSAMTSLGHDDIIADPPRRALMVGRLRELINVRNTVDNAIAGTWVAQAFLWLLIPAPIVAIGTGLQQKDSDALILVIPFGIMIGLGLEVASYFLLSIVRESYRKGFREKVAHFVRDYSRLVESWGGEGALVSEEMTSVLLKQYDPEAYRPGLIGRLFGG